MVDTVLLDKYIRKSGYRIDYLSSKLGITTRSFNRKRTNKQSFMVSEVNMLRKILNISKDSSQVFFLI